MFPFLFGKTYTADAMRPLPSFLLLCASYGGTAIEYGLSSGQYGLDYCIAEADTTSEHDSVDHHGSSNVSAPCARGTR